MGRSGCGACPGSEASSIHLPPLTSTSASSAAGVKPQPYGGGHGARSEASSIHLPPPTSASVSYAAGVKPQPYGVPKCGNLLLFPSLRATKGSMAICLLNLTQLRESVPSIAQRQTKTADCHDLLPNQFKVSLKARWQKVSQ